MNRVEIAFCDKNIPNDPGFVLELSQLTKYDQMIEAVAERVGIDKHRIQIFKCQRYKFYISVAFDTIYDKLYYCCETRMSDIFSLQIHCNPKNRNFSSDAKTV